MRIRHDLIFKLVVVSCVVLLVIMLGSSSEPIPITLGLTSNQVSVSPDHDFESVLIKLLVEASSEIELIRNSLLFYNADMTTSQANYQASFIFLQCRKLGVDPLLMLALGIAESKLRQSAVSSAGAVGIFQLTPVVEKIYSIDAQIFEENVIGGISFLRDLIIRYGDYKLALGHYNGGSNPEWKIEHYPETKKYVNEVLRLFHNFKI